MEVSNFLGPGLLEKPYENALTVEFDINNIPFEQQKKFPVDYKGITVCEYIPDLVVFDKIIVDIKSIEKIGSNETAQMLNYLNLTKLKLGLILNFKHSKLEWKRLIL